MAVAAFAQLAESNATPPVPSAPTYWFSARFGFGGFVTSNARFASTAPTPSDMGAAAGAPVRKSGLWRDAFIRFTRNRAAVAAVVVFGLIVLYCVIVPFVSPYDPNAVNFKDAYLPVSPEHPFGTDKFGRDLFTRIAVGGRISIAIGFAGTIAIMTVGVVYGSISGFLGGAVDDVLMGKTSRRRIERLEEAVVHRDRGIGEGVQERRLARVGVARERDDRRLGTAPGLALRVPPALELLQTPAQLADPAACEPAIGLELRLAGAAGPDAAAEALQVLPHAAGAAAGLPPISAYWEKARV